MLDSLKNSSQNKAYKTANSAEFDLCHMIQTWLRWLLFRLKPRDLPSFYCHTDVSDHRLSIYLICDLILLLTCSLLLKCQRNSYLLSNYNHQLHYFMRMAKSTKSVSTSSSTSSSYSATSLRCYAHVPGTTGDIMPFKRTTWSTYLRCVGIWKDLVGNRADIARC